MTQHSLLDLAIGRGRFLSPLELLRERARQTPQSSLLEGAAPPPPPDIFNPTPPGATPGQAIAGGAVPSPAPVPQEQVGQGGREQMLRQTQAEIANSIAGHMGGRGLTRAQVEYTDRLEANAIP